MSRGLSIWLDALRVWATLIVVGSHVAYPRFTRGDYIFIRDLNLGSDSVIVFFVISGMVIAYAAGRDTKLSTYAFNRLTRLLSVLMPALILTFLFDQIGRNIGPATYDNAFYNPLSFGQMLIHGLTMSNEWGSFERVRLGTNGPLWSLSYEAAYYAIFAAAFFLSGVRRAAIVVLIALVAGPRALLLMPAWLMGVWLWNWVASNGPDRLSLGKARLYAWGGPVFYVICLWAGVPQALATLTSAFIEPHDYRVVLAFSDEFLWNGLLGAMTAVHIMGMARLLNAYQPNHPRIHWWANASFSIYVTHYPVLHLIDAIFPAETLARDGLLLVGSISVGLAFAYIFERRIVGFRKSVLAAYSWLRLRREAKLIR